MTHQELLDLVHKRNKTSRRMSAPITLAVSAVVVDGQSYRTAARQHNTSESGIFRALERLGLLKSNPE